LGKNTKLIAKRLDTEFFLTSGNLTKKTSRLVSLMVERRLVFYFAFIYYFISILSVIQKQE